MKKRITGIFAAMVLAVAAVFALTGCEIDLDFLDSKPAVDLKPQVAAESTLKEGVLTVGINAENSPYGGTNSSGETVGLDVDIAAAIADELGLKLQIVDVNSNGRAGLTDKKVDVALGLSKTGSNEALNYSSAYLNDGASLFSLESNKPEKLTGLDLGKNKILVQAETSAAFNVQEAKGIEAIQATQTMQEAFDALAEGKQPYLVADAVIGDYFARNYADVVWAGFLSADSVNPIYAVTLSENTELSGAVNKAVDTITQNGVLRVIVAKWVGDSAQTLLPGQVDLSALPKNALGDS